MQQVTETTSWELAARAALADEAKLTAALSISDIVPQLLLTAQLTGRDDMLRRAAPLISGGWSFLNTIPRELQAEISAELIAALRDLAAGRAVDVPRPSLERFRALISYGVGEQLPIDYAQAILEEWPSGSPQDHSDERSVRWRKPVDERTRENVRVAIVGAGLSGLCLGAKLREAGIPFTIYEKNARLGGTWFENTYPGCAVDIPNALYSFSFAPNPDWSREFSGAAEMLAYLERFADDFDVRRSIVFGAEVIAASFDEQSARWQLVIRHDGDRQEQTSAPVLAMAVGQLNRPKIPAFPGLERFQGAIFHTARWNHDCDISGKRVAMIGTGASSIQVGPSIAPDVSKLTIFQRSAPWVSYNPNYLKDVPDGMRWALANVPLLQRWHRALMWWAGGDALHAVLQKDASWPTPELSLNDKSEAFRQRLLAHLQAEVGDDPALLAKVTPSYPPYGKRMLRDTNWFKTLKRDNVELVPSAIAGFDETGLVDESGRHHEADVVVLATGFHASRMLWPVDIAGRGGTTIRDVWGDDDPRAYLGVTVPRFPNMFILYGPNTNLAHGSSIFFHSECQVRHIMLCLREMAEQGHSTIECRQDVHDTYNARVDEAHAQMIWTHGAMNTWYRNAAGRVVANSPWRVIDYWQMTRRLDPADYHFA